MHTINRVYDSLLKQNHCLFEWLIIDDGSTDSTKSYVNKIKEDSPFIIRYKYQINGGKHRAHNTGVKMAKGLLTIILDSDDQLIKDGIEVIWAGWNSIPIKKRKQYVGIWSNCVNQNGVKIGKEIKRPFLDGNLFNLIHNNIITGEKLPCFRTEILKNHPYPTKKNCNEYVPEGVVWFEISEMYKIRFLPDYLRVYHQDIEDENAVMNIVKNDNYGLWGRLMLTIRIINICQIYFPKFPIVLFKAILRFIILIKKSGYSLSQNLKLIENKFIKALIILIFPARSILLKIFK